VECREERKKVGQAGGREGGALADHPSTQGTEGPKGSSGPMA
jgi:hypothetical protein